MLTEQEKNAIIERRQIDAKADLKILKRDFYDDLPRQLIECLDKIYWRWQRYDWFEEAWNKYRDYVLECSSTNKVPKAPGFIFNDYIDDQVRSDFLNEEENYYVHSDQDLNELFHSNPYRKKEGVPGGGQFTSKEDPDAVYDPDGSLTGGTADSNKGKKQTSQDGFEKEIKRMKEENARFKIIKEYNDNVSSKEKEKQAATEADIDNSIGMMREGRNITNELSNTLQERRGSLRINPKETKIRDNRPYRDISDDELRKRVNRMQLERTYGDLTGDAVYKQTGKEKTREYVQTIGSLLGIAMSALTIYKFLQRKKNG